MVFTSGPRKLMFLVVKKGTDQLDDETLTIDVGSMPLQDEEG